MGNWSSLWDNDFLALCSTVSCDSPVVFVLCLTGTHSIEIGSPALVMPS